MCAVKGMTCSLGNGILITLEGCEGSGKSTQARLLHEDLIDRGMEAVFTREPGGTVIGEKIRKILLHPGSSGMEPLTELLLYIAARKEHMERVIRPALGRGAAVIIDRFTDATLAYQGYGRGLDTGLIGELNDQATGGLEPDLTLLFELGSVEEGLRRALDRHRRMKTEGGEDRFEKEALDFHRRVREGYLDLARLHPGRISVVDGLGSVEEVHRRVLERLEVFLAGGVAR